jgi:hypothetical protein
MFGDPSWSESAIPDRIGSDDPIRLGIALSLHDAPQKLTDRLNDTNKLWSGLSVTAGYQLEDRASRVLPRLLRRDYEIEQFEQE